MRTLSVVFYLLNRRYATHFEISGVCHGAVETFSLQGCYAVFVGTWLLLVFEQPVSPTWRGRAVQQLSLEDRTCRQLPIFLTLITHATIRPRRPSLFWDQQTILKYRLQTTNQLYVTSLTNKHLM